MNIGISTSVVQRGKTGIAQHLFALLREMVQAGDQHRFTLFVLEEDLPLLEFAQESAKVVPVSERWRPPTNNILWHQVALPRLANRLSLNVLHVPSYRRMLWSKPCALVATIHDLAPFRVPGKYDWKRMFYGRVIARRLAKRQDQIIAVSQSTAKDIESFFGITRERLTVIPNGLEHARFFPGSREAAREYVAKQHGLTRPFFLYVARLEHPGKNHVRLISAFEEFKAATHSDWQLVLGGSDWNGAEFIHGAIRQSPAGADIRCLGFVPEQELPDLYRAASVFVYPSLYEGFGMPPTEAMACGCPVISSACGSLGEVLGGAAALTNPEDIHSIAKQLFIMATDTAERNRLRAAGLTRAQKFQWNRAATETLKVYERAVAAAYPDRGAHVSQRSLTV